MAVQTPRVCTATFAWPLHDQVILILAFAVGRDSRVLVLKRPSHPQKMRLSGAVGDILGFPDAKR